MVPPMNTAPLLSKRLVRPIDSRAPSAMPTMVPPWAMDFCHAGNFMKSSYTNICSELTMTMPAHTTKMKTKTQRGLGSARISFMSMRNSLSQPRCESRATARVSSCQRKVNIITNRTNTAVATAKHPPME